MTSSHELEPFPATFAHKKSKYEHTDLPLDFIQWWDEIIGCRFVKWDKQELIPRRAGSLGPLCPQQVTTDTICHGENTASHSPHCYAPPFLEFLLTMARNTLTPQISKAHIKYVYCEEWDIISLEWVMSKNTEQCHHIALLTWQTFELNVVWQEQEYQYTYSFSTISKDSLLLALNSGDGAPSGLGHLQGPGRLNWFSLERVGK